MDILHIHLAFPGGWSEALTTQLISANHFEAIAVCIAFQVFVVSNMELALSRASGVELRICVLSDNNQTVEEINRCLISPESQRCSSFTAKHYGPRQQVIGIPSWLPEELSAPMICMRNESKWPQFPPNVISCKSDLRPILSGQCRDRAAGSASTLSGPDSSSMPSTSSTAGPATAVGSQWNETEREGVDALRAAITSEAQQSVISIVLRGQLIKHRAVMKAFHVAGTLNVVADNWSRFRPLTSAAGASGIEEPLVRIPIVARHFPSDPLNVPLLLAPLTSPHSQSNSGPSPYHSTSEEAANALRASRQARATRRPHPH